MASPEGIFCIFAFFKKELLYFIRTFTAALHGTFFNFCIFWRKKVLYFLGYLLLPFMALHILRLKVLESQNRPPGGIKPEFEFLMKLLWLGIILTILLLISTQTNAPATHSESTDGDWQIWVNYLVLIIRWGRNLHRPGWKSKTEWTDGQTEDWVRVNIDPAQEMTACLHKRGEPESCRAVIT